MELPKISDELKKRIVSAGILAPMVLLIIWLGGAAFNSLVVFMAVIMSFEWCGIVNNSSEKAREIDDVIKKKWLNLGIFYVGVFASSLLYLRNYGSVDGKDGGSGIVLVMLLMVWATDIAAYFAGRLIGGPKIYPKISPNKTWAGLAGGMLAAGFVGIALSVLINFGALTMFLMGALTAIVAQSGDFLESWIKRKFGVKDSGNIIPGHGGIMDRMDGFVTVAPFFAIFVFLYGNRLL
jgi:phosphatidate cytidylyltransferase